MQCICKSVYECIWTHFAFFHASHEYLDGDPIIGLDVPTNLFLNYQKENGDFDILTRFLRRPDLVLSSDDDDFPEQWIEAKSVQSHPSNDSGIRPNVLPSRALKNWSQSSFREGDQNYHRQFYLDWVANVESNHGKA